MPRASFAGVLLVGRLSIEQAETLCLGLGRRLGRRV